MNSPWGRRGELCKHFGWTYEYLMWGISWLNVQLMIADQPEIEYNEDAPKQASRKLETKEDILNYVNAHKRR